MTSNPTTSVDPITLSTVWHGFQALCREMRLVIERTAQSYLMSQLKDVSVGLWRADGATIAIPEGLLSQFLGTQFAIEEIKKQFGDDLHPGDVILTNDPYHGGHNVHLPDWGFIRPIFVDGELEFFTLVRGHMMDTGGSFPGGYFANGYDIHSEGLCIPPIKVVDRGVERTDVLNLIWNNVRFREQVRLDNYSMIAATRFAENRMLETVERYGKDTVLTCIEEMIQRTEKAVRAEISSIPDGTYSGEAATDDDGTTLDEPVWVRVDVHITGDEMELDFSRSDAQRTGFVNSPYAATYGAAMGSAILSFDSALANFHNEGTLRPLKFTVQPRSVVNPEYPATVGAAPVNVGRQIVESVTQAMSLARPERAMAGWGKHRGDYTSARDPRTGLNYVRTTFDYDGSAGAVYGHDGPTGPAGMGTLGSVMRGNVEEQEIRFPWRVTKLEVVPNFSGAGRWRGGGGVDWRAVNEGSGGRLATGSSCGDEMLARGVLGGAPSPVSRTFIERDGELIRLKPHRMGTLEPGDVLIKLSSGGGGAGEAIERDPEAVAVDVQNGYYTLEGARRLFGVVLDPETGAVDEAATAQVRSQPLPQVDIRINEETLELELDEH